MSSTSKHFSLLAAGITSAALIVTLLSLQYSYGVGIATYSLGRYLWINWTTVPDMEHGFLVLPAIAYLIYEKRRELLEGISSGASILGLAVLTFGLLLFWAGNQADVTSIGLVSMMIVVVGNVWFLLGWRALTILAFPIGFFIFAIPLPGLDIMIAFPLRMIMSQSAVFILDMIGVDVIRQGTGILSAPDALLGLKAGEKFSVDVADPCSGIRSLFALMMVSSLYAHFTLKTWWEKWLLFLSSIPLAILGNLTRILALTIGTILFGAEFAIGKNALTEPSWFHMLAGYLVFAVAIGGMICVERIINYLGNLKHHASALLTPSDKTSSSSDSVANQAPSKALGEPKNKTQKTEQDPY